MHQFLMLQEKLLARGIQKADRTGTGTLSNFGNQYIYDIWDNTLAAVTTRKIHMPTNIVELIWMLSGDTNVKFLKDNKVGIWDDWVDPMTAKYRDRTVVEMRKQFERKYFGYKIAFSPIEQNGADEIRISMDTLVAVEDTTQFITYHATEMMILPMVSDAEHVNWIPFYELVGISRFEVTEGDLGSVYGKMLRDIPDLRSLRMDQFSTNDEEGNYSSALTVDAWQAAIAKYQARGFVLKHDTGNGEVYLERRIDQVKELLQLLETDPDSRRLILCLWNPAYRDEQALPPCHSFVQFYTRLLTPDERYALYVKRTDDLQARVLKNACDNPEDFLANSYTHVTKISRELFKTEEDLSLFLDTIDVPKRAISCMLTMRSL